MKAYPRRAAGFTLIELMIVVVVVGVLAMVAFPSYQEYVRKNNRAEGKAALMNGLQVLERSFTTNNAYPATLTAAGLNAYSGQSASNSAYTITLTLPTATTFQLRAAPTAKQTGDRCGTLVIDQAGTRTVEGATWTAAQCW
jgi:type IV pilus assembly protein PilE